MKAWQPATELDLLVCGHPISQVDPARPYGWLHGNATRALGLANNFSLQGRRTGLVVAPGCRPVTAPRLADDLFLVPQPDLAAAAGQARVVVLATTCLKSLWLLVPEARALEHHAIWVAACFNDPTSEPPSALPAGLRGISFNNEVQAELWRRQRPGIPAHAIPYGVDEFAEPDAGIVLSDAPTAIWIGQVRLPCQLNQIVCFAEANPNCTVQVVCGLIFDEGAPAGAEGSLTRPYLDCRAGPPDVRTVATGLADEVEATRSVFARVVERLCERPAPANLRYLGPGAGRDAELLGAASLALSFSPSANQRHDDAKVGDYLRSGVPVLCDDGQPSCRFVRETGHGFVVPFGAGPEALSAGFQHCLTLAAVERRRAVAASFREAYGWPAVARQVLGWIDEDCATTRVRQSPAPVAAPAAPPAVQAITVDPRDVVTRHRLDVVLKTLFFRHLADPAQRACWEAHYRQHIQDRTGGAEPPDLYRNEPSAKHSLEDYVSGCEALAQSMSEQGFDSRHPIPVYEDGTLANGAHRLACALATGCRASVTALPGGPGPAWDFRWFLDRGYSSDLMADLLYHYAALTRRALGAVILWGPVAHAWTPMTAELEREFGVVGWLDASFEDRPAAFESLVRDMYALEWAEPKQPNIARKVVFLNQARRIFRVVLVEAPDAENAPFCTRLRGARDRLRTSLHETVPAEAFCTCHASTSADEARYLIELLLGRGSRTHHPLRKQGQPREAFGEWLRHLPGELARHGLSRHDVCIVGSSPLEVVGLRDATDIDITVRSEFRQRFGAGVTHLAPWLDIVTENYHRSATPPWVSDEQLIQNARHHFWYRGFKFANVELVLERKAFQARPKDLADVEAARRFFAPVPDNGPLSQSAAEDGSGLLTFLLGSEKLMPSGRLDAPHAALPSPTPAPSVASPPPADPGPPPGLAALIARAEDSTARGHQVLADLLLDEARERFPGHPALRGLQNARANRGPDEVGTAVAAGAAAPAPKPAVRSGECARTPGTPRFVSFLLPYVDRGMGPLFHWVMLLQAACFRPGELVFIGDDRYFDPPKPWEPLPWEQDFIQFGYCFRFPDRETWDRIPRYSLPRDVFHELETRAGSMLEAFRLLLTEDYPPLREALTRVLEDASREGRPDAVLSWCHAPSLKLAAAACGIPVIHNELGPLRPPLYQGTVYFDFNGVNGCTSAAADCARFIHEAPTWPDFQPLSLPELRALLARSPQVVKPATEPAPFKAGVALQVEDDSNLLAFSRGFNHLQAIFRARRGYRPHEILLRRHPHGYAAYSERLGALDDSPDSVTFLRRCEEVYTINSSVAFECLLQGKPVTVLGDSPASSLSAERLRALSEAERVLALNYLFLAYLVPAPLLFDREYYLWRLSQPTLREIYSRHLAAHWFQRYRRQPWTGIPAERLRPIEAEAREAVTATPPPIESLRLLASLAEARREPTAAADWYRRVLDVAPTDLDAILGRAEACHRLGDRATADGLMSEAASLLERPEAAAGSAETGALAGPAAPADQWEPFAPTEPVPQIAVPPLKALVRLLRATWRSGRVHCEPGSPEHRAVFDAFQNLGLCVYPVRRSSALPDPHRPRADATRWHGTGDLSDLPYNRRCEAECARQFAALREELLAVSEQPGGGAASGPASAGGLDALIAYAMIRRARPRQIVAVGGGADLAAALEASRRNHADGAPATVRLIDPSPELAAAMLPPGVEVAVAEAQSASRDMVLALGHGDLLLLDLSRARRVDGEAARLGMDVLPFLNVGVLVQATGISFPPEGPAGDEGMLERLLFGPDAFVLRAFLSHNRAFEVVFAAGRLWQEQRDLLRQAFPEPALERAPESLWFFRHA